MQLTLAIRDTDIYRPRILVQVTLLISDPTVGLFLSDIE
jgi:hypothetical protein